MTGPDNWKDDVQPKVADETDYIVRAFCDRDPDFEGDGDPPCRGPVIKVATAHGGIDYMYAEGEILIRDDYLERVLEILEHRPLRELERDDPSPVPRVIAGVARLTTLSDRYPTVLEALDVIDGRLGAGIATPNHVLTVCPTTSHCPATEPEEVYADIEPYPSVCHDNGGGGVQVYMADTGILDDRGDGPPVADRGHGGTGSQSAVLREWHAHDPALLRARHVRRGCGPVHGARR